MFQQEIMMVTESIPKTPHGDEPSRVIERPDGFYWQDELTDKFFGPFTTLIEAVQDMQSQSNNDIDSDFEEGESLEEAEAEIGISNWIDPETGEPAVGLSPHLSDE
jgi:hypothetical protein